MDFLAKRGEPARATDIADALSIARSSTDQLLKSLVTAGYLVMTIEDKRYFPSIRIATFGKLIAAKYDAPERLEDLVQAVYDQIGETATLTMQNGCFMQMLTSVHGTDDHPVFRTGAMLPVLGTAVGSAVLSTKSPAYIRKFERRCLQARAIPEDAVTGTHLVEQVRLFRMKGYSWSQAYRTMTRPTGHVDAEYLSIAMPLPGQRGTTVVVLGMGGPANRIRGRETEVVNLMRRSIRHFLSV